MDIPFPCLLWGRFRMNELTELLGQSKGRGTISKRCNPLPRGQFIIGHHQMSNKYWKKLKIVLECILCMCGNIHRP